MAKCGIEFGPENNRQSCTLEAGHSPVRNGFGHWCETPAPRSEPNNLYRVYYKRVEGKLSLVVIEQRHFEEVAGMFTHNMDGQGYKLAWHGSSPSEIGALALALPFTKE